MRECGRESEREREGGGVCSSRTVHSFWVHFSLSRPLSPPPPLACHFERTPSPLMHNHQKLILSKKIVIKKFASKGNWTYNPLDSNSCLNQLSYWNRQILCKLSELWARERGGGEKTNFAGASFPSLASRRTSLGAPLLAHLSCLSAHLTCHSHHSPLGQKEKE